MAGTYPREAQSRSPGHHPRLSLSRFRGRVGKGAGECTGPGVSVAMPDCPANSPGKTGLETGTEGARGSPRDSALGSDRRSEPVSGRTAALPLVRVMLPLPLPEPLDYLVPDGAAVPEPGSFVRVTLGPRRLI